jgi:hypothetical protein
MLDPTTCGGLLESDRLVTLGQGLRSKDKIWSSTYVATLFKWTMMASVEQLRVEREDAI